MVVGGGYCLICIRFSWVRLRGGDRRIADDSCCIGVEYCFRVDGRGRLKDDVEGGIFVLSWCAIVVELS